MGDVNKTESRIAGAEMRYFRKCTGKRKRDRIRKSQIRGILNQEPVPKMVDKREQRWFGHLIRIDGNRKPRQVGETNVEGMCRRARPGIEWKEHMWKLTRKKGKTVQEVRRLAKDREALWICNLMPEKTT